VEEWEREPLLIMIGQADTRGRGAESARREGEDDKDGVGGTLIANVVDLSRNMYFMKRTAERARVTI
jgi:hypothetical protein